MIFAIVETCYFGSNWFPMTKPELLCDLVAMLVATTGLYLWNELWRHGEIVQLLYWLCVSVLVVTPVLIFWTK